MKTQFVHLQVHTEYSMIDSLLRIEELIDTVARFTTPAVAVTDENNLFCLIKFYRAALAKGVKAIFGSELWVGTPQAHFKIAVLCKNKIGYRHLTELLSCGYTDPRGIRPVIISPEWLYQRKDGLIILSDFDKGDVGQALWRKKLPEAASRAQKWLKYFGENYYLTLNRVEKDNEEEAIALHVELAKKLSIPVVATHNVRFVRREDFEAHEARVCIASGDRLDDLNRKRLYTEQQYLKSATEMGRLFQDIPEALENSVEIAKRCNVHLTLNKVFFPTFTVTADTSVEEYLSTQAKSALQEKLQHSMVLKAESFTVEDYLRRLEVELSVINNMGFAGYFLIVADFISWAKAADIPVGPGRGSGVGSLVAYVLGITGIDPLPHDLLFERFLNPERISMPDFDVDFCMEGRDRVIDYVAQRYGTQSVAQIITYGSMAARAVVRDVGRVLGLTYGFVDKIAKLIPFELGMTLEKALKQQSVLSKRYAEEEDVRTLIDLSRKLEGLVRNAGKHAGGVVIAPSALTDFLPLYCEPQGHVVTQFDKDDVETIGLVKFDFLGLRTLTIIRWALQTINIKRQKAHLPLLDIETIALDDSKTYELLRSCKTTALFQLESRSMKDLVRRLQPDQFNDIVALVALMRPGPLQSGMVDTFIQCKQGQQEVIYPHPELEGILKSTYGVILYQEQVMQIAQVLAGYSLGDADILRRAMGKKKYSEMEKQRAVFLAGAKTRGVNDALGNEIFDLMEKFSGYGFNKSHAVAYALITYQTAWLKAHYPAEFMSAVLSADMDHTEKMVGLVRACGEVGLIVIPPDINKSQYLFTVTDKGEILYGLGAVKGVGASAVSHLVEVREKGGIFKDLFDLCCRTDSKKLGRRSLEPLIRCGAMDNWGVSRSSLYASLEKALQVAEQIHRNKVFNQEDLFTDDSFGADVGVEGDYVIQTEWTQEERLRGEKETLGIYVSGHPLAIYARELKNVVSSTINQVQISSAQAVVAGMVTRVRTLVTKTGKRMAILVLEDQTAQIEVTVFNRLYEKMVPHLEGLKILVVRGKIAKDDFTGGVRMVADSISTLEKLREIAKRLVIAVDSQVVTDDWLRELQCIMRTHQGGACRVKLIYCKENCKGELTFGTQWQVSPADELIKKLKVLCGSEQVCLEY